MGADVFIIIKEEDEMLKKFNWIIILSLIVVIFITISAIAATKQVQMNVVYATGDPLNKQLISEAIAAFMKKYPNVKIVEDLSISTGAYKDSLVTKDAVGQFPDFMEMRDAPIFVRAGKLAPLPKELLSLFEKTIPIYGTVYTAPFMAAAPVGAYYNKKLFKENGWTEPKTYGEFIQLCEKIKAKGIAPLVAGTKDIWHMGFPFATAWVYIGSKNPNWIADRYENKVHFTDSDFAKGMKQVIELFTKGYMEGGYMSTTEAQCPSILISGNAAMYISGTHVIKPIMEGDPSFDLGWFPIPDANGKIVLIGGSTKDGWALSKQAAKDPQKVKVFTDFVKFFMEKKQYTYYCKTASIFPTTKWTPEYEMSPIMKTIMSAYGKAPKTLNWNQGVGANEQPPQFRNWTYKKMQEMAMGTVTVENGLKQMEEEWTLETRDFNPTKLVPTEIK